MTDKHSEEARRERAERLAKAMAEANKRGRSIMEAVEMAGEKLPQAPIVVSTRNSDIHVVRPRYGSDTGLPVHIAQHARVLISPEAAFAVQCIERWGMVAAEIDGEDTAGRQKMRRLTAAEIVQHACDVAEKAYAEFEKRGWIAQIPSIEELADKIKDAENSNG